MKWPISSHLGNEKKRQEDGPPNTRNLPAPENNPLSHQRAQHDHT